MRVIGCGHPRRTPARPIAGGSHAIEHRWRTLYVSADRATVQALHPDNPRFQQLTDEDRVIVSEPLSDLPGVWNAVPEATALVVQRGPDEFREFHPQPLGAAMAGTS
jgi:glutamine amidotransferase